MCIEREIKKCLFFILNFYVLIILDKWGLRYNYLLNGLFFFLKFLISSENGELNGYHATPTYVQLHISPLFLIGFVASWFKGVILLMGAYSCFPSSLLVFVLFKHILTILLLQKLPLFISRCLFSLRTSKCLVVGVNEVWDLVWLGWCEDCLSLFMIALDSHCHNALKSQNSVSLMFFPFFVS